MGFLGLQRACGIAAATTAQAVQCNGRSSPTLSLGVSSTRSMRRSSNGGLFRTGSPLSSKSKSALVGKQNPGKGLSRGGALYATCQAVKTVEANRGEIAEGATGRWFTRGGDGWMKSNGNDRGGMRIA